MCIHPSLSLSDIYIYIYSTHTCMHTYVCLPISLSLSLSLPLSLSLALPLAFSRSLNLSLSLSVVLNLASHILLHSRSCYKLHLAKLSPSDSWTLLQVGSELLLVLPVHLRLHGVEDQLCPSPSHIDQLRDNPPSNDYNSMAWAPTAAVGILIYERPIISQTRVRYPYQ